MMSKKIICILAVIILGICLVSGGCDTATGTRNLNRAWKDLIKLVPEKEQAAGSKVQEKESVKVQAPSQETPSGETSRVKLYFAINGEKKLGVEERTIAKTEGIARSTIQELIKGPESQEFSAVFPPGSKLRDINIKEDGTCVIDLSPEVEGLASNDQEKLMIYAVANTLGQFPTVKEVSFLIDGQKVDAVKGGVDLSSPVKPEIIPADQQGGIQK
ncbi:MAG: GerMN domain-containing protein [Syntrophomonas sp.]